MSKLLNIAILSLFVLSSKAQVSFSVQLPPSVVVQRNQLWNITLINSGNTQAVVTIDLSIFDAKNDQPLMTARTRSITLSNGIKQIRESDVGPIDYRYLSSSFDLGRLPGAFLPVGEYRACYTILSENKNGVAPVAEDCINLEVAPMSPPQLNLPSDSAIVQTPYPQFSWLPPTPAILFSDLNYDLLVTEVQQGQSAYVAIQENLPVYVGHRITLNAFNYPASNKGLDTGRIYAWRIVAKNGETFAAQSDVWTFSLASKKPEQIIPSNGTYFELKDASSFPGTGIIPDNILGIKYYSYDQTHDSNIRFLDEEGRVIKEIPRKIQYGNNFLVFKLDNQFSEGKLYSIEIVDLQSSHFKASFRIQSNKSKN